MISETQLADIISQDTRRFKEITDLIESSMMGGKGRGLSDMDWRNLLGCYKTMAEHNAILNLYNQHFQNQDVQETERMMDKQIMWYEDMFLAILNDLGVVEK